VYEPLLKIWCGSVFIVLCFMKSVSKLVLLDYMQCMSHIYRLCMYLYYWHVYIGPFFTVFSVIQYYTSSFSKCVNHILILLRIIPISKDDHPRHNLGEHNLGELCQHEIAYAYLICLHQYQQFQRIIFQT